MVWHNPDLDKLCKVQRSVGAKGVVINAENYPTTSVNQNVIRNDIEVTTQKKHISVSPLLHNLIKSVAIEHKMSYEQVVSSAVLRHVKTLTSPQSALYGEIYKTEREIKQRYHATRSNRSRNMYRINRLKRYGKIAPSRAKVSVISG